MLSFFPRDVLDEILNLIESVSEGFRTYSFILYCVELKTRPKTIASFPYLKTFRVMFFFLKSKGKKDKRAFISTDRDQIINPISFLYPATR